MIQDALNTFFTPGNTNAQPTGVGTTTSDIVDLGPLFGTFRDIAAGQRLKLRVQVETGFTSGGAGTLQLVYGDSPNPDGSAGTARYTTAVFPLASLVQGAVLVDIGLPDNFQRYLYMQPTVATAAFTAGALRGAILEDTDTPAPANVYPSAIPATGF